MVKIVLKPKFRKLRDEARKKINDLQESRIEAAGPNRTSAIIKKVKDLEAETANMTGRASWSDSKEVEEHRVDAWVGDDKPYELASDNAAGAANRQTEQAATKAIRQALDEDFYRVGEWSDAKIKFAYVALGGKEKSVSKDVAVQMIEDAMGNITLTD